LNHNHLYNMNLMNACLSTTVASMKNTACLFSQLPYSVMMILALSTTHLQSNCQPYEYYPFITYNYISSKNLGANLLKKIIQQSQHYSVKWGTQKKNVSK